MATFTLNWDNSLLLAEPNAINQRASYRIKSVGGLYLTTGFTPSNDMATSVISATHTGTANKVYQFKLEALCTSGGPTANDNGVVEQIVFECITPVFSSITSTSFIVTIDTSATDISKVKFTLKKQGDDSLVAEITSISPGSLGDTIATFTGLTANTAYYLDTIYYATVNGVEVRSNSTGYLDLVCGGNISGYQVTTSVAASPNIVFSWNRVNGQLLNLTDNINGSFTSVDWGDGTINTSLTHTYLSTANFTVRIYGSTATNITLADGVDAINYNITAFTVIPTTVTHLDLHNNLLTSIVSLVNNTSLIYLDYSHNAITSFPDISNNILLQEIYLNDNDIISSCSFTLNTALTIIDLSLNSITGISGFTSLTALYSLNVSSNSISVSNINSTLIALDDNGITSGIFNSLPQSPVAAPTGLGLTAKNNLTAKSWTMSTD